MSWRWHFWGVGGLGEGGEGGVGGCTVGVLATALEVLVYGGETYGALCWILSRICNVV